MFGLLPKANKFFDLLEKATSVVCQATDAYANLVSNWPNRDHQVSCIRQLEHDCDAVTHSTLELLDQSFITPFDREDIQSLIMKIDDVVDEIDAATKRIVLYRIEQPTVWLVKQTEVLQKASKLLAMAVPKLRNLKKPNGLQQTLVEIHQLENEGDDNNHAAVSELYNNPETNPLFAMKWKEIYDQTERAIDRCEDIADIIQGIVLKNG